MAITECYFIANPTHLKFTNFRFFVIVETAETDISPFFNLVIKGGSGILK